MSCKINKNGFTLVELIAVIVIVGILATVAVPKFMNMKIEAKNAALQGLATSIKSVAAEFNSAAILAGILKEEAKYPDNSSTNTYTANQLFDYKTGFYYNLMKEKAITGTTTEGPAAIAKCTASPTCVGVVLGYPRISSADNPNFYGDIGGNIKSTYIAKLLNMDSKFTSLSGLSTAIVVFYFTEDQAAAVRSNLRTYYRDYPFSFPCTVTYIPATSAPVSIYEADYNPTTNSFVPKGSRMVGGDGTPYISVQPCIK